MPPVYPTDPEGFAKLSARFYQSVNKQEDCSWTPFGSMLLDFGPEYQEDKCWLWTGGKTAAGYGILSLGKSKLLAHRVSYFLVHRSLPEDLHICHNCPTGDNPSCVNPAHLFAGTPRENWHDCRSKGRAAIGEKHPAAILTIEQVRIIHAEYKPGNGSVLARRFGVSQAAISLIIRGIHWKECLPENFIPPRKKSRTVLDPEIVCKIRAEYVLTSARHGNGADLGRKYGIPADMVCRIVRRDTYKDLP
jgi:hypothetical protein